MKKEVQLTLIVETDDNDKEIQQDLEMEISHCYHSFDVDKCEIRTLTNLNTSVLFFQQ